MTGQEPFTMNGEALDFNLLDFWQFHYSGLFNISEYIAEFLVARALGITEAFNCESWTLYDIDYNGIRIEVKMSAYFHPELTKISETRTFSIKPVVGVDGILERQNDIYIFCLSTGRTREEANPLDLDQWEFYVVPTYIINENCGREQKTISLNRVKELSGGATHYDELRTVIDDIMKK